MTTTHTSGNSDCTSLHDGARVCFRSLEPADGPVVEEVFAGLGAESRRERYHGPKPSLGADDLAQLLSVDHSDHEAVVAFDVPSGRALAIARFVRDGVDPDVAEVAFEVVDDWHGRGLGKAIVCRLARRARALRVGRFRGFVLARNEGAKAVLRNVGPVAGSRFEGSSIELVVELA
jgi:RimJ/RimL family protein N-acetyltransferase